MMSLRYFATSGDIGIQVNSDNEHRCDIVRPEFGRLKDVDHNASKALA